MDRNQVIVDRNHRFLLVPPDFGSNIPLCIHAARARCSLHQPRLSDDKATSYHFRWSSVPDDQWCRRAGRSKGVGMVLIAPHCWICTWTTKATLIKRGKTSMSVDMLLALAAVAGHSDIRLSVDILLIQYVSKTFQLYFHNLVELQTNASRITYMSLKNTCTQQ
jgi:hypothetical protein